MRGRSGKLLFLFSTLDHLSFLRGPPLKAQIAQWNTAFSQVNSNVIQASQLQSPVTVSNRPQGRPNKKWTDGTIVNLMVKQTDERMDGQTGGQMDREVEGQMYGQMDR